MSHPTQIRLADSVLGRAKHVCAFFQSKEEKYSVLVPLILEWFNQGDQALHVSDPRNRADHLRRLGQAGTNVGAAEREGMAGSPAESGRTGPPALPIRDWQSDAGQRRLAGRR